MFGLIQVISMLLIGGCQTPSLMYAVKTFGGEEQQVTMPPSTCSGAASGEQANVIEKTIVDTNNNSMKSFDEVYKRLDKVQGSVNKVQETSNQGLQTAQKSLAKQEQMANQQGAGELTLLFKIGSAELEPSQYQRLVRFLDYVSAKSNGRKVILLSIGSASAIGNPEFNKKLSMKRSETPLPVIEKHLVNVPHEFYKVTGTGDKYAPKGASKNVNESYQSDRLIAVYDTSNIPKMPEDKQ